VVSPWAARRPARRPTRLPTPAAHVPWAAVLARLMCRGTRTNLPAAHCPCGRPVAPPAHPPARRPTQLPPIVGGAPTSHVPAHRMHRRCRRQHGSRRRQLYNVTPRQWRSWSTGRGDDSSSTQGPPPSCSRRSYPPVLGGVDCLASYSPAQPPAGSPRQTLGGSALYTRLPAGHATAGCHRALRPSRSSWSAHSALVSRPRSMQQERPMFPLACPAALQRQTYARPSVASEETLPQARQIEKSVALPGRSDWLCGPSSQSAEWPARNASRSGHVQRLRCWSLRHSLPKQEHGLSPLHRQRELTHTSPPAAIASPSHERCEAGCF
jgi:hypothetical protein